MLKIFRKYNYGLVLSGGGARAYAHVGVLKALHEHGIFPELLSCVSAGAIVGALYADGYSPEDMMKLFSHRSLIDYVSFTIPRNGLVKHTKIQSFLQEKLRSRTFADLKLPLTIAVTNYNEGIVEYISEGDLIPVILASCSIPVVFTPTCINRTYYFDGGLLDNLPVLPVYGKCRCIIGSHVNPIGREEEASGVLKIAERTFHLGATKIARQHIPMLDIFIEPQELSAYGMFDFSKAEVLYTIGYNEAMKKLKNKKSFHAKTKDL